LFSDFPANGGEIISLAVVRGRVQDRLFVNNLSGRKADIPETGPVGDVLPIPDAMFDLKVAGREQEWLVRNGLALDWPRYSESKYSAAQRDAAHTGRRPRLWAGS
jgi:hypothetical protein